MFFASDLGAAPWDVFHEGLAERLDLPVGLVIELIGAVIILAWFPLGLRLGWATLLNAIEIGLVVMLVEGHLPTGGHMAVRIAYMVGGLMSIGIGSGIYIGVGLGTGPRDGLMLGLANDRVSVRLTRTLIEATVLVAGIALGGTAGVGTALFAFGIGPVVQYMLPRLSMRPSPPPATPALRAPATWR